MQVRSVIWLGVLWAVTLVGFQHVASARYAAARPDPVLDWTARQTALHSHDGQPYLLEPFWAEHVAWDSEFYLSIAIRGYDDPAVRAVRDGARFVSLNYAFFPLYPAAMRVVAAPLSPFLNRIAAATLAGVLVSILGAIAAAVALFLLVRADHDDARAYRAAFLFLVFPSAFFLAQVYTEGLFTGLAFGALALARHRRLGWAALAAVLATWTRAVGVFLVLPLAWAWLQAWRASGRERRLLGEVAFVLAPVAAFVLFRLSPLGVGFAAVERTFFDRAPLALGDSLRSWTDAAEQLAHGGPEQRVYYALELGATALGLASCAATFRRAPGVSLFGLASLLAPATSGLAAAQGMIRFVLCVPSVFVVLSGLGERSPALDRAWTVASVLLLGLLASLFTFDLWVA